MVEPVTATNPLVSTQQIVNKDGTPSLYFLRQWAAQQLSNSDATNLAELVAELSDQVAQVLATEIIASTGLAGGGAIGDGDVTLLLADTAVTPGTYGSATNVAQVTVDQQGRITAAQNVAISGSGGGESWAWPSEVDSTTSGSAAAFKGMVFTPLFDMTVSNMAAVLDTVSGATYKFGIYRIDGSDQIDEVTAETAGIASPGTATFVNLTGVLSTPASLTAGNRYFFAVGRTDAAASYVLPLYVEQLTTAKVLGWPSFPAVIWAESTSFPSGGFATLASTAPALTQSVSVTANQFVTVQGASFSL